jgi:hypothetical protein
MGMPKIELRLQMFRGDWDQIWSQMRLLWAMEGLCRINQTHLRQMNAFKERGLIERPYPALYRAGVHYETEKGTEIWPDIPSLYSGTMGPGVYPGVWGDCEDLACVRVAEYRELPWHYARPLLASAVSGRGRSRMRGSRVRGEDKPRIERADPRFPQGEAEMAAQARNEDWPGWQKVKGGVKAKPFAKWRRGPHGNYHYHALLLLPDGRLEDPSLVLGMGREKQYAEDNTVEKLRTGTAPVKIQYAKPPDVMVVDPEKPSGYSGGKAAVFDAKVAALLAKGMAPEQVAATLGDVELGSYLSNEIPLGDGEFDVDAVIGWNRKEGCFEPKSEKQEANRLLGYANH